jgi:2-polyprenyl-3-methyl-5-hydroxy-6-metoxy-1,4-benzoquinol methylase
MINKNTMNPNQLNHIREEEKKYHERYFEENSLYEKGSWLEEPSTIVLDFLSILNSKEPLQLLDLGCGVGRNSIPMARKVKDSGGRVVCVDLLEKALEKLEIYAEEYKVGSSISVECADISDFFIEEAVYDYIVAASSLEHVKSKSDLNKVLRALVKGTKASGINLICMNTNIKEFTISSGDGRQPLFEILIAKDNMLSILREAYQGWEVLHVGDVPLNLEIIRDETPVMLKADHLIFAARKPSL